MSLFLSFAEKNLITKRFYSIKGKPLGTLPKGYYINNSGYLLQNMEIFLGHLRWKIIKFLMPSFTGDLSRLICYPVLEKSVGIHLKCYSWHRA